MGYYLQEKLGEGWLDISVSDDPQVVDDQMRRLQGEQREWYNLRDFQGGRVWPAFTDHQYRVEWRADER